MYKYLLLFLILFAVSGCRTTYYRNDLIITPRNEKNRTAVLNDVEIIYHDICKENDLDFYSKASPENPVDLYTRWNVDVSYDHQKMKISIISYKKQRVFEITKRFYDILKENKDINIKMEESTYPGIQGVSNYKK